MSTDTDGDGEELQHFESVARDLLADDLAEVFEQMPESAAFDIINALRTGDREALRGSFSTHAVKHSEFVEHAIHAAMRAGDMESDGTRSRLFTAGADANEVLVRVTQWFEMDQGERQDRALQSVDNGRPVRGSPEHAAETLLSAWEELDDVAREEGDPLPEELQPPEREEL